MREGVVPSTDALLARWRLIRLTIRQGTIAWHPDTEHHPHELVFHA